jgi:hypothetical protein
VRSIKLSGLAAVTRSFAKLPPAALFILLAAVFVGLMFAFPARLHLLGDSEIILALTPKLPSIGDASANFRNQPLTYDALRLIQFLSGGGAAVEPVYLYSIADAIAGVVYLGIVFFFLRKQKLAAVDAFLLGILLLLRVGTQFFFGYVENYMFFYVVLTAYVMTGWLALEGKGPLWLPLALLAVVPGFHLAGAVFLPTAFFLLGPGWKDHRRLVVGAAAGIALVSAAIVLYLGPSWMWTRVANAFQYDLLPLTTPEGGVPYGIFSRFHLIDWANAYVFIAPFAFVIVAAGLIAVPRVVYIGSPSFRFLSFTALTGLAATFVILPGLGMARDWDMLSNFFVPLRFLSIYFLIILLRERDTRHVLLMLAVASVVQWGAWTGINSNEERHLARAEMLSVPELSGTFPKLYYDNLGKTLYNRKEYARAAVWYERYLGVDSLNPRILANLSACYRALGDSVNVFRTLERSLAAGTSHPGVYSNLAIEYVSRGDTARAIEMLYKALELDPEHIETRANLSILELHRGHYREGLEHALAALRLGATAPILYRNAGYASYFLGDYKNALLYFDRYLQSVPTDAPIKKLADALRKGQ